MTAQDPNGQKWQMTAKLGLLLGGIALVFAGFAFATWKRGLTTVSVLLIAGGFSLLVWSATIHQWCEPISHQFGPLSGNWHWGDPFYAQPSLQTCLDLVFGEKK